MSIADFERLKDERYVSLATYRKNGTLVPTPVWAAPDNGRLYVVTGREMAKVKRLRSNDRARIAVCDVRGNVRGEWTDVRARTVADANVESRALAALHRKYGWQIRVLDFFARVFGRIGQRAFIEIEF